MDEGDRDAAEQERIVLRLRQRVIASANCCEALEKETRDKLQRLICLLFPASEEGLQKRKVKKTNLQTYLGPKQILFREPDPTAALWAPWWLFWSLSSAGFGLLSSRDGGPSGAIVILGSAWGGVLLFPPLDLNTSPSLPQPAS